MDEIERLRAEIARLEQQGPPGGAPGAPSVINSGQPEKFTFLGEETESKEEAEAKAAAIMRAQQLKIAELEGKLQAPSPPAPAPNQTSGDEPIGYRHSHFRQEFLADDAVHDGVRYNRGIDYALRTGILGPQGEKAEPGSGYAILRSVAQGYIALQQERHQEKLTQLQAAHPELNLQDPEVVKRIEQTAANSGMNPNDPRHREAVITMLQAGGVFPTRQMYDEFQRQRQQNQGGQPEPGVIQMRPGAPPRAPQGSAQDNRRAEVEARFARLIQNAPPGEAQKIYEQLEPELKAAGCLG